MTPQVVKVYWDDACTHHGQYTDAEARQLGPAPRISVGWLIEKTKTETRIATDYDPPSGWGQVSVIKNSWITKMEKV